MNGCIHCDHWLVLQPDYCPYCGNLTTSLLESRVHIKKAGPPLIWLYLSVVCLCLTLLLTVLFIIPSGFLMPINGHWEVIKYEEFQDGQAFPATMSIEKKEFDDLFYFPAPIEIVNGQLVYGQSNGGTLPGAQASFNMYDATLTEHPKGHFQAKDFTYKETRLYLKTWNRLPKGENSLPTVTNLTALNQQLQLDQLVNNLELKDKDGYSRFTLKHKNRQIQDDLTAFEASHIFRLKDALLFLEITPKDAAEPSYILTLAQN